MAHYHQFVLRDAVSESVEWRLPSDEALVRGEGEDLVVLTGAYSAPIEVRVQTSAVPLAPLGMEWEDVVELSVRSSGALEIVELMGEPQARVVIQPGWHRLRVVAQGRDDGERRGEAGPRAKVLERFLIQAWPAPPAEGVTVRATSLRPVDHAAGRIHLASARGAARRINAALAVLQAGEPFTGETGAVDVQWIYRATRRKLFRSAALPNMWTSAAASESSITVEPGTTYRLSNNYDRDIWDGLPTGPQGTWVHATLTEVTAPKSAVTRWEWVSGADDANYRPLLTTHLTIHLDQSTDADATPMTTVTLHHDVPHEWLEDIRTCWLCKLEAGEHVYRLTD